MKKINKILFVILIAVSAVGVCACTSGNPPEKEDEGNSNYSLTFDLFSDYYAVTGIKTSGNVTSVTVPAEHDGKPVTSIYGYAFENCAVKEITLPESITEIGQGAFKNCKSLESIVIPNSVETLYSETFFGCTSLETVQLSNKLKIIADFFDGCSALKSISIPASVTSIYGNPFKTCESLTSITADAQNDYFVSRGGVLYDKYQTQIILAVPSITSIDIPDTVTSIGENAFCNCKKLTAIRLPNSVESIGYEAFKDCTALNSVCIPEDIWSLSSDVFSGCHNITEAVAPLHVLSVLPVAKLKTLRVTKGSRIENNFFKNYTSLEEVELTGVEQIGQYAFSGLNNLKSVTLSGDVTDIGKSAFSFCDNLKEVHYTGDLAEWCAISFEDTSANPLKSARDLYIDGELVTEISIEGVGEIKQYAFNGFDAVTKITISGDLHSVGKSAFSLCENLTEVRYTGSLSEWCAISFYDAYANPLSYAHNLYINDELVTELAATAINEIKQYAFSGCDNLTKIELSNDLQNIGFNAFYNCDNIVEAILPATFLYSIPKTILQTVTITSGALGEKAFKDCNLLKTVTLSSGVTAIGSEAFDGCSALDSISIPPSVGSIGGKAFSNCTSLVNIEISGPIDTIRQNTFYNCTALTEFIIPPSVTKIERSAFYGCKSLTKIDISSSVTEIEQGAFAKCEKLNQLPVAEDNTHYSSVEGILYDKNKTTIYFVPTAISGEIVLADTLNVIGDYAFSGCGNVTGVSIPAGVSSIGQYAFSDCVGLTSICVAATACTVGENAFFNVENIIEAVLPASLVPHISKAALQSVTVTGGAIGENAFTDCAELETVTLSDGVTEIGGGAFKNTGITSIVIPDTVTSVGANTFENCRIAEAVINAEFVSRIPKAVLQTVSITGGAIGENAFKDCAELETVTLSEGVTEIGENAFSGCGGLTGINIPSSVTNIGVGAFKSTGITSIEIPDTVASLGANAFENCNIAEAVLKAEFISRIPQTALQTVSITGGAIGENAFKNCAALDAVKLNNGVTQIGDGAFSGCAITELDIPSSVTSIGQKVFVGCNALNGVTVDANNENYYVDNGILYRSQNSFRDIVFAPVSLSGKVAITINVRSVFDGAFYGCDKITSLDIGKVSSIGEDAFYGCNNIVEARLHAYHLSDINKAGLQKVEIVGGTIAADALSGCTLLSDITISNSVYGIGRHAFDGTAYYADESNWASGILYINKCLIVARPSFAGAHTVRSDTELIADGAFDGCAGLTGIDIPSSVAHLGNGVFDGCGNVGYAKFPLKYISAIPKGKLQTVEIYGSGAIAANEFNGLTTLKSLTVSDGVTKIGDGAFGGCSSLAAVDIADSVEHIGDGAFSGTAYLNNDANYENGVLYIVNSLIAAKPALTGEYTVKANAVQIAAGAFDGCSLLTGITVPASVSSIGDGAFDGCASMQRVTVAADNPNYSSYGNILYNKAQTTLVYVPFAISGAITLPNTLTGIPDEAFKNCIQVTAVQIPNTVTSIGSSAFYGCAALGAIALPSSVTSIGDGAFYGCAALTTVSVPYVQTVGSGVFDGCDNIVNATLHGTLTSQITKAKLKTAVVTGGAVADEAFMDCAALTSIELSDGVTGIGDSAFSGCVGITEIIIPDSVTSIGFRAFYCCGIVAATLSAEHISDMPTDHLTMFTITGGAIGYCAFKDFYKLSSVTICEGVTAIGESAFSRLDKITSLHIPSTVTSIGKNAFYDCANMESISVAEDSAGFVCTDGILYDKLYLHAIYAPAKLSGDVVLPNAVNYVDEHAFYGCTDITSVTISDKIVSISYQAFAGCSNLSSVKISANGYVSVDNHAFDKCPSIVSAYVPADVLSSGNIDRSELVTVTITSGNVGNQMFRGCTELTEITLMQGVTGLGQQAFSGCTGITSLTIPSSVTGIENNAFYGCTSLSEINIPNSVTIIGDNAFSGCVLLGGVEIPNSVTSIGSNAFYRCAALTVAEIPGTVTRIGDYAFSGCTGLTTVIVPKTVMFLGNAVFAGCENIESATVPGALISELSKDKLTSATIVSGVIPSEAFKNRTGLTSITLMSGVTTIGAYAFDGCTGIETIDISNTVTVIGTCAFRGCENVTSMSVDSANNHFVFDNVLGVLYNKSLKTAYFAIKQDVAYYTFPDTLERIEPYAFAGRKNITTIYLPAGLNSIGEYAFKDCSNLENVEYSGRFIAWSNLVKFENAAATWRAGTQVSQIYCTGSDSIYYYSTNGMDIT